MSAEVDELVRAFHENESDAGLRIAMLPPDQVSEACRRITARRKRWRW